MNFQNMNDKNMNCIELKICTMPVKMHLKDMDLLNILSRKTVIIYYMVNLIFLWNLSQIAL